MRCGGRGGGPRGVASVSATSTPARMPTAQGTPSVWKYGMRAKAEEVRGSGNGQSAATALAGGFWQATHPPPPLVEAYAEGPATGVDYRLPAHADSDTDRDLRWAGYGMTRVTATVG
jgi:hypothetical protein